MMTKQEVFEKIATHLFTQGVQSRNERGCAYRGQNGLTCAIGCLIPDEVYFPWMENEPVSSLRNPEQWDTKTLERVIKLNSAVPELKYSGLVDSLQATHDTNYNWESTEKMQDALRVAAMFYSLDHSKVSRLSFKDR